MGHGIFSGHNSLNVTMRLAGCHIDVILKLQQEAHNISDHIQTRSPCFNSDTSTSACCKHCRSHGAQSQTHLAGDGIQWQKVKIWQVEEDRLHFWHPA